MQDPHAGERAFDFGCRNPPLGVSLEKAAAEVRDVLDSIHDACPECLPESISPAGASASAQAATLSGLDARTGFKSLFPQSSPSPRHPSCPRLHARRRDAFTFPRIKGCHAWSRKAYPDLLARKDSRR